MSSFAQAELEGRSQDNYLLAPAILLSALVCLLAGAASLRIPLSGTLPFVDAVVFLMIGAFLWRAGRESLKPAVFVLSSVALIAAWCALADFSGRPWASPSETISPHPDAWSYNAFANYLANNPRGRNSGMSTLDQYGAHLADTRFASPGLLVFLKAIPGLNDPARANWTFAMACFVAHFFSLLYFARGVIRGWYWPIITAFTATAGGWLGDALYSGNYDNLLFASLSPALIGVAMRVLSDPEEKQLWWWGAIIAAATVYAYPEGWALLFFLLSPFLVILLGRARRNRSSLVACGAIAAATFLLILPYLPMLVAFLVGQISIALQGAGIRPGAGSFSGLLDHRFLPSLFALGEEVNPSYSVVNRILPAVIIVLIAVGVFSLSRKFRWYPWVGLVLIGLIVWQAAALEYDYGTYKVILCASWWTYTAMIAGLAVIVRQVGESVVSRVVPTGILFCAIGFEKFEDRRERPTLPPVSMQPLREVQNIHAIIGDSPVLLDIDGEFDGLWSVYYLRNQPISLANRPSYLGMPHLASLLERAAEPRVEECKYVLVSGTAQRQSVWHNARFSLVREDQPRVVRIDNPNGLETVDGQRFIWLGTRETAFRVVVAHDGDYELRANQIIAGPSGPETTKRDLRVGDGEGSHVVTVDSGTATGIPLRLRAGENLVTMQGVDVPRRDTALSNRDPRELLLGLKGFYVIKAPYSSSSIR